MKIAHITDLHVEAAPSVLELASKRIIGATNLYLMGRKSHFTERTQQALVDCLQRLGLDAIVCTGDLTALATETEFLKARALLEPLLQSIPFYTISGNHDLYTQESVGRFEKHFGAWARIPPVLGGMIFYGLPVCHPDWLSRGWATDETLRQWREFLDSGSEPVALMLHYPLRNRKGEPYGPWTRALENASALEETLGHDRVRMVLHGHEHHGYQTEIATPNRKVRSLNPGASGYAFLPDKKRTAHFNVYTVQNGELSQIERYAFDGTSFVPEPGGAYATGG